MKDLADDRYRYLEILDPSNVCREMKATITALYLKHLGLILKFIIHAKIHVITINIWAVAVVYYSTTVQKWTRAEIDQLD